MILVTKWFGVFLCDGDKVKKHILFGKDPQLMAERMAAVQRGEILLEEEELAGKGVRVSDPRLSKLGKPVFFDSSFIKPENYGLGRDLMHEVMVNLAKLRTREPVSRDRCILQAIRAIDDLIETINLMSERLHEWYGLYFPELSDYARDERYPLLILDLGDRDAVIKELELDLESVGHEMEERDIAPVRDLAAQLIQLYKRKSELETYLAESMEEVAPNLTHLLTANLGARLISLAGGLKRLSQLPSSTVQLLGAEKAMFLHLKNGKRPPKHGVIYQHPLVHRAAPWQRGKMARTLAGKISIAAKVDEWGGEFIADRLKEELDARAEEIKKKYPNPPKRKKSKRRK
ncbi:MAG: ribosomal biogenesis protein [Methanomassiliicoccales archaeon]|nr:ribosomal biogenesis protein [Methanomassiliicoccales archaeon]NYT14445.1 ribosomal biogenesis protein [Methanomassiliicoccales archaeon]